MSSYLGVDGGGSKTAFALIDHTGLVLGRATAGSSYYFQDGFDAVQGVLKQGIGDVCAQAHIAPSDLDAAFFGIPGYGEASHDLERIDHMVASALGHRRYSCDNDMVCGWAGSLACSDGINVISGTGSMTYGERRGSGHRAGGWGELFGDEGSAYWIATQGLNAFSRMSDGRVEPGPLQALMRDRLSLTADLDVVSLIIDSWSGSRSAIAALATTVCQAAQAGDEAAATILARGAVELVALVQTTRKVLGFEDAEVVAVSYSGGMFSDNAFRSEFTDAIAALPAAYQIQVPRLDPALGAALYAAKHSGTPLTPAAIERLAE